MNHYSLLSLGDSYTIGESIQLHNNMPYQVVQALRKKSFYFYAPEIIAQTGWTTKELDEAVRGYQFLNRYDFITLMIGVNNQFRGQEVTEYKDQLEILLKKVIELSHGKKDHVIMISIPDYSFTPFAGSMDTEKISREIDVYNSVNKALSIQYKVQYVDITSDSRAGKNEPDLIAGDGLHPSVKGYEQWADKVAAAIAKELK